MRKTNQSIKLFMVITVCTAYIFSFSHFGVLAYNYLDGKQDKFSLGTSIATVNIGEKTKEQALKLVNNKIAEWTRETKINLQLSEKSAPLDIKLIHFDPNSTIQHIQNGQENLLNVSFNSSTLVDQIGTIDSALNFKEFDKEKLVNKILTIASGLKTGEHVLNLEEFLVSSDLTKATVLGKTVIKPNEVPSDLQLAIGKFSTIEVKGQSTFSLLAYAEFQNLKKISPISLSIIASGIYQAILTTNFTIIERNTSQELPGYVLPGFEAKVDLQKNNDFVFNNPNRNHYTIKLSWHSDGMHVSLNGYKFLNKYKVQTSDIQYFPPKTIKQYSPLLENGEIRTKREGRRGMLIKVYREEYQNNQLTHKELISEDFYPPIHKIEVHPLTESTTSDDHPVSDNQKTSSQNQTVNEQKGDQVYNGHHNSPTSSDNDLLGKPNEESK